VLNAAEAVVGDHGRRGGEPPRIVLRGSVEPGERGAIRLTVEDNGRGIDPADLPHIFTPFFTTREGGTGLGLALVQKAAIVHDGQVEAASVPGRGTQVAIVLPQRPIAPTATADLVA
jgi:signal transduction histidine kinase